MTLQALLIQALLLLLPDGNSGGLQLREILDTNVSCRYVIFFFLICQPPCPKRYPPKIRSTWLWVFVLLIDRSNFQISLKGSLRIYCYSWQNFGADCFEAHLSCLADWRCCWCAFLISLWSGWSWSKVNFILLKSNQC